MRSRARDDLPAAMAAGVHLGERSPLLRERRAEGRDELGQPAFSLGLQFVRGVGVEERAARDKPHRQEPVGMQIIGRVDDEPGLLDGAYVADVSDVVDVSVAGCLVVPADAGHGHVATPDG